MNSSWTGVWRQIVASADFTFVVLVLLLGQACSSQTAAPPRDDRQPEGRHWINYAAYESFFEYVSKQNQESPRPANSNDQKGPAAINYAATMSIDANDAAKVLAIALEQYRKELEADARLNCDVLRRREPVEAELGPEKAQEVIAKAFKNCNSEKPQIVREGVLRLEAALDAKTFEKVDDYMRHEKWIEKHTNPCIGNMNPGGEKQTI